MNTPICLSPLKFYDDLNKQNHRKTYAFGHVAPLLMRLNIIDAFQFVINSNKTIKAAYIVDANTDKVVSKNIINTLKENGLITATVEKYFIVSYPGILPVIDLKFEGLYYLKLQFETSAYYSEVFCFSTSLENCLEIKYWNPEGYFYIKGGIIDLTNTKFIIRINSELGKPEYKFEEEATKRLGYTFIESQVSSKIYKFNTILPEYLCDALRLVRLCSNKQITFKNDIYDACTFEMTVDWQEQGDLASVTCEFEIDDVIVNFGGYAKSLQDGDFNGDFNNDFSSRTT